MSFTDDMERLQAVIDEFEDNDLGMEKSLALFEEGVKLVKGCREYLEHAKRRVTILTADSDADSALEEVAAE